MTAGAGATRELFARIVEVTEAMLADRDNPAEDRAYRNGLFDALVLVRGDVDAEQLNEELQATLTARAEARAGEVL